MILLIGFVCSGCDEKTFSTSDANTYLKEKSEFNENIKNYLPSYEELKDAKIVFYTSYNNYKKEELPGLTAAGSSVGGSAYEHSFWESVYASMSCAYAKAH